MLHSMLDGAARAKSITLQSPRRGPVRKRAGVHAGAADARTHSKKKARGDAAVALVYSEGKHALETLAQIPSPRAEEAVCVGGDGHDHEQGHADDVAVGIRHDRLLRAATRLHRHL